jgi:hypothetical protein
LFEDVFEGEVVGLFVEDFGACGGAIHNVTGDVGGE